MAKSASSSAPTPVNHRSPLIPVTHTSKTSLADVLKQTIQDHHFTKDDAFKGFMSIIYASHMCAGSADSFQSAIDHLLQKKIVYHHFLYTKIVRLGALLVLPL